MKEGDIGSHELNPSEKSTEMKELPSGIELKYLIERWKMTHGKVIQEVLDSQNPLNKGHERLPYFTLSNKGEWGSHDPKAISSMKKAYILELASQNFEYAALARDEGDVMKASKLNDDGQRLLSYVEGNKTDWEHDFRYIPLFQEEAKNKSFGPRTI